MILRTSIQSNPTIGFVAVNKGLRRIEWYKGKFVQMNALLSKSPLKFLVYLASVASLATP
jgi:hypothetical protein